MLAFMAYVVLIAALLGLAALAIERGIRDLKLASRGIWFSALLASVVLPFLAAFTSPRLSDASAVTDTAAPGLFEPAAIGINDRLSPVGGTTDPAPSKTADPADAESDSRFAARVQAVGTALRAFDAPLRFFWMASSAVLLLAFGFAALALRRAERGWRTVRYEASELLVSDRTGPAMFGLLRPRIVVPEWLLAAPESLRSLAIRHEREHAASRDQWLLAFALVLMAAAPWNPFLWWQLRRLRAAIEIDCDARILEGGVDAMSYSRMLLSVRDRRPAMPLAAVALHEPASLLERRIRILLGAGRPSRTIGALGVGCAAVLVAAACSFDAPVVNAANPTIPYLPADGWVDIRIGEERVAILVDVSASMNAPAPAKWQQTADVVGSLAARIPPEASFQIIAFNDAARSLVPSNDGDWLPASDRRAMGRAVQALREETTPSGPKDLTAAVTTAAALEPPPQTILLVTDGLPAAANRDEQARDIDNAIQANAANATINVILLPQEESAPAAADYWRLALSTGGLLIAPATDAQRYESIADTPGETTHLILIVDSSGSMRRYEWDRLMSLVAVKLAAYPALEGIQVLSDQGSPLFPDSAGEWLPDTPTMRQGILEELENWSAFSTSNPRRGILQAIDEYYRPGGQIALFVFSDDFSAGTTEVESVIREIDNANRLSPDGSQRVRINTVAFPVYFDQTGQLGTSGDYAALAREVSRRNGGVFVGLPPRR